MSGAPHPSHVPIASHARRPVCAETGGIASRCRRPIVVVVSVAVLAVALSGCEAPPPSWMSEAAPTPTMFAPESVSTDAREYGITFSPDGREAYFTRRSRRGPPRIYLSRFENGGWTRAEPAPFSVDGDESPFMSRDGTLLLFASRRPTPDVWDRSENLWMVERGVDGWLEPTPLAGEVNRPWEEEDDFTRGSELGPILLDDGTLLYWSRMDPEWGDDLYVASRDEAGAWVEPRPLLINSYGQESNPAMSPDGRYLIFQGYRDAAAPGDQDLYVSERTDYGWTTPRPLPEPVNSSDSEGYPSFSPDGRFFFFASDRADPRGYYDIYYVGVEALGLGAEPYAGTTLTPAY